jgi:hypothetical protein
MTCERVVLPGGQAAIVCSSGRRNRCACGRPETLLCDWKVAERRSGTCDASICDRCSTSPVPGKDLCPAHAEALAEWKTARCAP